MLLALLTAIFMAVGYAIGGSGGMMIAFAIAAVMNLMSWWNGDKMVLAMNRAVEAKPENAPEFFEIVRRLAEAANLPMPRVYLIDTDQPNAFATGRDPEHAAVAATTGLLRELTPEEVAGVMAHELAHVANRDTLTMTITATLAGAISMLGNFAFFMGGRRDNGIGMLGTLLAIIVAPFAAMIVQMAVSRTREYAADRLGAEICGRPRWLAAALAKIARLAPSHPNRIAEANPATAHLYIYNPLGQYGRDSLFSTHPAAENRIAALMALADEMEAGEPLVDEPATRSTQIQPAPEPAEDREPRATSVPSAGKPARQWGRRDEGADGDDDGGGRPPRRTNPWS